LARGRGASPRKVTAAQQRDESVADTSADEGVASTRQCPRFTCLFTEDIDVKEKGRLAPALFSSDWRLP
jgi:hypothetical protein